MPRRKLVRRFEPRYGVSAQMREAEAAYVARERSDYELLSVAELREKLGKVSKQYRVTDEVLVQSINSLPERDQLAVRTLVARDLYLILELYCTHLGVRSNADDIAPAPRVEREAGTKSKALVVPFSEWLFGSADDTQR